MGVPGRPRSNHIATTQRPKRSPKTNDRSAVVPVRAGHQHRGSRRNSLGTAGQSSPLVVRHRPIGRHSADRENRSRQARSRRTGSRGVMPGQKACDGPIREGRAGAEKPARRDAKLLPARRSSAAAVPRLNPPRTCASCLARPLPAECGPSPSGRRRSPPPRQIRIATR